MISVIIPVYNLEKYLHASLNSILQQTYTDIEIICVDDLSQDNSLQILQDFAARDPRIQVYVNKVKGHCGGTRNYGLTHARGEYIYFFDGDDILEADALETLIHAAQKNHLDIVYFNGDVLYESKSEGLQIHEHKYNYNNIKDEQCSGQDFFVALMKRRKAHYSVNMQLYKKSFLETQHMHYSAGLPHEDVAWTFVTMLAAERVQHLQQTFYHRRIREQSVVTSKFTIRNIKGMALALQRMQAFYRYCVGQPQFSNLTLLWELIHIAGCRRAMENMFLSLKKTEQEKCLSDRYLLVIQAAMPLSLQRKIKQTLGVGGRLLLYLLRYLGLDCIWVKTILTR